MKETDDMASATSSDTFPQMGSLGDVHMSEERRLPDAPINPVMETRDLNVYYGDFHAVHDVNLAYGRHEITAMIGPSGCGKSTVLRCLNRMNDLVTGAHVEGEVLYHGQDIYEKSVDPIAVRTHIGMVFQKPNPFPKSIYDNIAYGPRVTEDEGRQHGRPRRGGAARRRTLGRGQGQAQAVGVRPLRRPAAAPLHRPDDRRRSPT